MNRHSFDPDGVGARLIPPGYHWRTPMGSAGGVYGGHSFDPNGVGVRLISPGYHWGTPMGSAGGVYLGHSFDPDEVGHSFSKRSTFRGIR